MTLWRPPCKDGSSCWLTLAVDAYKSWKVSGNGGRWDSGLVSRFLLSFSLLLLGMPVSSAPEESQLSLLEYSTKGMSEKIANKNIETAVDGYFNRP